MEVLAVLFDSDGVLTLPEEVFDVVYTQSHGLDSKPFKEFFRTEWRDFVLGKRDLKEHITSHPELWQWNGDADSLLDYWCKVEDIRNDPLIELIMQLGQRGLACYLATEQEKYRAAYMKDVMFPGVFKDHFVTCDIGYTKSQPEFYMEVVRRLQATQPSVASDQIVFFDDSQSKVEAALSTGINAQLYKGIDQVRDVLGGWLR